MKPSRRWCALAPCALAALMACSPVVDASPQPNAHPAERGTIVVVCGLGGGNVLTTHVRTACARSGLNYDVGHVNWGHGKGRFFHDLRDHENVKQRSMELADAILKIREKDPQRRITILAWSGGVGVALGAAEMLPDDSLDRIVLMCAACSPHYNLYEALRASKGGIVSFRCHLDQFFLTFITATCGTIDRRHGTCAGMCGFKTPIGLAEEEADLYTHRLTEIVWTPAMIRDGHTGNHLSYMSTRFLCHQVLHWLR